MSDEQALLQVEKLTKKFGDKTILNEVDLAVPKGKVIVILGPSGCGKSTFLRCLNGLEEIQGGEIILDGDNLTKNKVSWQKIRQKIGMVFQSYDLFPNMTVIENILLGPLKVQKRDRKEVLEQARQLLDRVGLADRGNDYPRQLSGGQKQRIAIVRSLCMNPEIMLFDEVTASLDPEMVREVLDVILQLAKQGMTMIIVTHEMNFARLVADEIIFMDKGQICETGEPENFFTNPQTDRAKQFLNILQY
ncbi:MAG TPA: amino acid ABC transporter ATP-binding protein [Bacillales bacterium]|nr:amino acid ABC transporter ATP-binding protein [Bacillales bacterium]